MSKALDELVGDVLDLEDIERDIFRGRSPQESLLRVFGGQVAAQAMVAAGRTVDDDRAVLQAAGDDGAQPVRVLPAVDLDELHVRQQRGLRGGAGVVAQREAHTALRERRQARRVTPPGACGLQALWAASCERSCIYALALALAQCVLARLASV